MFLEDSVFTLGPPALHIAGYDVIDTEGMWFPDLLEQRPRIGLALAYRDDSGNIVKMTTDIATWNDSPQNQAERDRLRLLLVAMCRYRNTGGSDFDGFCANFPLHNVLRGFHQLPTMKLDPEWHLYATDGAEHIFEKADKSAYIYVVEGEFTELMTPDEFEAWHTGTGTVETIQLEEQ
jgi:hypothetical protein